MFRVTLIKLPVANIGPAIVFYRDVLGLSLNFAAEEYGWAQFDTRPVPLALYVPAEGVGLGKPGTCDGLQLTTEDFDGLQHRLTEHHMPFDNFEGDDGTVGVYLNDPDGNRIQVIQAQEQTLACGDLAVDLIRRQAWRGTIPLNLTTRAFDLLAFLMQHPGEVIARERLLTEVWEFEAPVETRTVDMRIAELRKALDDEHTTPRYIETVIGQGYRLLGRRDIG